MKLFNLFILVIILSTTSFSVSALVIQEDHLEFTPTPILLEKGDIQMGLVMEKTSSFFDRHSFFSQIDFFDLQRFSSGRLLAAKFAFMVDRGIKAFGKPTIFHAEDFEKISKNVKVTRSNKVSPSKLHFELTKKIKFYSLTSHVDYFHFDLLDPYEAITIPQLSAFIEQDFSLSGERPHYVTLHHSYQFSNFFHGAANICFYQDLLKQTLITCYVMSVLTQGTVSTLGLVVNFKNQLRDELLFTIRKIKHQSSDSLFVHENDEDLPLF